LDELITNFLQDDSDDDLNDEDIPGFGAGTPLLPTPDKGKGRAAERVASPGPPPPPAVTGNIATPGNAPRVSSTRKSFGGMQVETRYAGALLMRCKISSQKDLRFPVMVK
jgi:protein YIPF6